MQSFIKKLAVLVGVLGFAASAHAVPVTVNMTGDNIISDGGLCDDASCISGIGWAALSHLSDWTQSDSQTFNLSAGTYYFAWEITNSGSPSSGNPAALLAEISWGGNANYSSSAWEIYDISTGNFIANATDYGANGTNIWGGPISGISTNAHWIYTANNFASADPSAWIRTSITIASVPEPATLSLLGAGLLGLGFARRKHSA